MSPHSEHNNQRNEHPKCDTEELKMILPKANIEPKKEASQLKKQDSDIHKVTRIQIIMRAFRQVISIKMSSKVGQ